MAQEESQNLDGEVAVEAPVELPVVAIIGRPNVGKSALSNRLIGARRSLVGEVPGMTRDRIYGEAEWQNRAFRVVDTGGIVPDDEAVIPANIFKQARAAIDEARLLLFMVDARIGRASCRGRGEGRVEWGTVR